MANDFTTKAADGHITIGRRIYEVFILQVSDGSRGAGVVGRYALVGPNGASYFVTDRGPAYRLNSTSCGGSKHQRWTPAPRPLAGLTRDAMAIFLESASA